MASSANLMTIATEPEILRLMECPVCHEIPFPPIFQCSTGHNICKSCKIQLTQCPICKGKLSDVRNYMAENILLTSKYICPNRGEGCQDELTGEIMETHVANCPYRPIVCPRKKFYCGSTVLKQSEFKSHLLDVHKLEHDFGSTHTRSRFLPFKYMTEKDGSFPDFAKNASWAPSVIDFNEKSFLEQAFRVGDNIVWTVSHIWPEDDKSKCVKYRAKITLQPGARREIQWTIPVEPIVKTEEGKTKPDTSIYISSCSLKVFKQMLIKTEVGYTFTTKYEIMVE